MGKILNTYFMFLRSSALCKVKGWNFSSKFQPGKVLFRNLSVMSKSAKFFLESASALTDVCIKPRAQEFKCTSVWVPISDKHRICRLLQLLLHFGIRRMHTEIISVWILINYFIWHKIWSALSVCSFFLYDWVLLVCRHRQRTADTTHLYKL